MSERLSSYQILEENAERVGEKALEVVDRTYGEGYPSWRTGSCELAYHNGHHARAVGNGALRLCDVYDVPRVERRVAETAGFAHDLVQLKGRGIDERESAEWLESELRRTDVFPTPLVQLGKVAILGTEPRFKDGHLVGQRATELEYPDKVAELVAKSVACADLGELYTPQGPYLGHQLFREIKGMPREDHIPFEDVAQFQRNQIRLLEQHTYPLKKAEKIFATHKSNVIRYAKETLRKIEAGSIDSWSRLIESDEAFMARHS